MLAPVPNAPSTQNDLSAFIQSSNLFHRCQFSTATSIFAFLIMLFIATLLFRRLRFAFRAKELYSPIATFLIDVCTVKFCFSQAHAIFVKTLCSSPKSLTQLTCSWCPFLALNSHVFRALSSCPILFFICAA